MFGKIYEKLDNIRTTARATLHAATDVAADMVGVRHRLNEIQTWVELLADTKADEVADEFEKLLDEHVKAKHKMTNKALKEMVHQAVLNAAK